MTHTFSKPQHMPGCRRKFAAATWLIAFVAAILIASQTTRAEPTLAPEVITAATPPAAAIEAFMSEATQLLQSEKAPEQEMGRNAIIKYVNPATNQPQPTAGFLLAYAKSLNSKLLPLAKNGNWRVRLNAVLAAERVAGKSGNAADELAPTIKAFLADANEGVVLWALKASKHVVAKQPSMVIPSILDAVKRFPAAASHGYEALSVDPPKTELVTAVQDLAEARIALYAQSVPPDALAERTGMNYLVNTAAWKVQTPQQQTRTAQVFANLSGAVNRQLKPDMSNDQKDELADVMRSVAKGIETVGVLDPAKASLVPAAKEIQKSLPRAAPISSVQNACKGVYPALKIAFPGISQPQGVAATNPSSADASASDSR